MILFKRIGLFILTNILIMTMITIVMSVLGAMGFRLGGNSLSGLAVLSLVWGMGGSLISLLMSRQMAKWMMGVKLIDPLTADSERRDLVSMVHELARRAGLPAMPEVGVYQSDEVNAFATGPSKSRSLVAVSSGLLARMNKDQLEGVLGHEITHIANGDMVTMTLIQGVVNAFVIFFSRIIATIIGQNVESRNRWIVEFISVIVLQIAFGLLGSVVVCYFSRQREFRADAGSASIAGRDRMIDALCALGRTTELIEPAAQTGQKALATLKIADRPGMGLLFSTHPPLAERIARLSGAAS